MKSLESRLSQLENKQAHLDRNGGVDVEEMIRQFDRNKNKAGSEFITEV